MMVRTTPVVLPAPDAMRAMERLEAQLRRAADDLAETLAEMRAALEVPLVELPGDDESPRCNHWMPKAKAPCHRFKGHADNHRSKAVMDAEADRKRGHR